MVLSRDGPRWMLLNAAGQAVGRLSAKYAPPEGCRFLRGEVGAVVRWRKLDNAEEWRGSIRRDDWETILPELVFARSAQ
ncbi:hypothetical protein [Mangrovicoccus ximenensis]|uniref:hypothetical protein n=1 Tax=Mangrovicoccus ximenensis TaxID=1911570 RepID=UPI001F342EF0|nr:hypothetical protein [Mangrovicoccus ximenensis]